MAELTITGLRVVDEVAARGSFTAAADALGYTQSAVSRQVALMERAAGAQLFERRARGVRATAAGFALQRHARAILDRVAAAELELGDAEGRLEGQLTIGAFPTAMSLLVPRAIAAFAGVHPGVQVRLREGGSVAQLRRLRAGRLDVAVIAVGGGLEYDLDGLQAQTLLRGRMRLAVGTGHRLAERAFVGVAELAGETWIVGHADASGPQFGAWPTLDESPRIAFSVRDWPARLGLVAADLGVAIVPAVMGDAVPPGVRVLEVDDPQAERRVGLAVTRVEPPSEAAALVDALRRCGAELQSA